MTYPTYDEWFAALPSEQQERTGKLVETFRALGADDSESWARSEISQGIAQLARFLVLRSIWREHIDTWRAEPDRWISRDIEAAKEKPNGFFADSGAALKRMIDAGVSFDEIASVARMVAYATAFHVLYKIDEGYDPWAPDPDNVPGWQLVETDAEGRPTGRSVSGLHESILAMDPSGREGRPA